MTDIATRQSVNEVVANLEHPVFVEQIKNSLPEGVSLERFKQVTITAVRSDPSLITGNQNSLFASVVKCAQDGLLPDGREAALVKFGQDIVYMPMIGGFRKIAAEHGWAIDTQVVYANDKFVWELGQHPVLDHTPAGLDEEPGDPMGAYAVATHADGRKLVEVMRKSEIEKVQAVSRSRGGPWVDWTERMWEKTVGRRIFGKLPLSGNALEMAQRLIRSNDEDVVLPQAPRMTADEADVHVALGPATPPSDGGPDDAIESAAVDADEPPAVEVQTAFPIPPGVQA
jgi:recombination protein RecT